MTKIKSCSSNVDMYAVGNFGDKAVLNPNW